MTDQVSLSLDATSTRQHPVKVNIQQVSHPYDAAESPAGQEEGGTGTKTDLRATLDQNQQEVDVSNALQETSTRPSKRSSDSTLATSTDGTTLSGAAEAGGHSVAHYTGEAVGRAQATAEAAASGGLAAASRARDVIQVGVDAAASTTAGAAKEGAAAAGQLGQAVAEAARDTAKGGAAALGQAGRYAAETATKTAKQGTEAAGGASRYKESTDHQADMAKQGASAAADTTAETAKQGTEAAGGASRYQQSTDADMAKQGASTADEIAGGDLDSSAMPAKSEAGEDGSMSVADAAAEGEGEGPSSNAVPQHLAPGSGEGTAEDWKQQEQQQAHQQQEQEGAVPGSGLMSKPTAAAVSASPQSLAGKSCMLIASRPTALLAELAQSLLQRGAGVSVAVKHPQDSQMFVKGISKRLPAEAQQQLSCTAAPVSFGSQESIRRFASLINSSTQPLDLLLLDTVESGSTARRWYTPEGVAGEAQLSFLGPAYLLHLLQPKLAASNTAILLTSSPLHRLGTLDDLGTMLHSWAGAGTADTQLALLVYVRQLAQHLQEYGVRAAAVDVGFLREQLLHGSLLRKVPPLPQLLHLMLTSAADTARLMSGIAEQLLSSGTASDTTTQAGNTQQGPQPTERTQQQQQQVGQGPEEGPDQQLLSSAKESEEAAATEVGQQQQQQQSHGQREQNLAGGSRADRVAGGTDVDAGLAPDSSEEFAGVSKVAPHPAGAMPGESETAPQPAAAAGGEEESAGQAQATTEAAATEGTAAMGRGSEQASDEVQGGAAAATGRAPGAAEVGAAAVDQTLDDVAGPAGASASEAAAGVGQTGRGTSDGAADDKAGGDAAMQSVRQLGEGERESAGGASEAAGTAGRGVADAAVDTAREGAAAMGAAAGAAWDGAQSAAEAGKHGAAAVQQAGERTAEGAAAAVEGVAESVQGLTAAAQKEEKSFRYISRGLLATPLLTSFDHAGRATWVTRALSSTTYPLYQLTSSSVVYTSLLLDHLARTFLLDPAGVVTSWTQAVLGKRAAGLLAQLQRGVPGVEGVPTGGAAKWVEVAPAGLVMNERLGEDIWELVDAVCAQH